MPIEIRELVIKVRITDTPKNKQKQQSTALSNKEKEELIRECYERVLEKIEARLER